MESDEIDLSIVISTFDIGHVTKISTLLKRSA